MNLPRTERMNKDFSISRRQFLQVLSGGGAVLLGSGGVGVLANTDTASRPAAQELADRYRSVTRYAITRKGDRIGRHEVRFTRSGDRLTVSVESNIRVTVLKIPVFSFNYVGEEIWENNQLTSVMATTTENRDVSKVSMTNDKAGSQLVSPKGTTTVDRLLFASNHWNANVVGSQRIFNTITGNASVIEMRSMGEEEIATGRGLITSDRYQITGDIQADVWYDKDLVWSRLAFKGKDGSQIDYLLE